MSGCVICGQKNVDGAVDNNGDYVFADCWADGSAGFEGRVAKSAVPADVPYGVNYPPESFKRFLDACNKTREGR
jgi:hypothetical protein